MGALNDENEIQVDKKNYKNENFETYRKKS